ncbi:hypothetical protein ACH4T9_01005 [Micromonospora sp. NPDC020750]|uniref:hypothetical protein n=1 Tax=unclassified Micromonospora TaxID=2617518 RepID=UPI00379D605F
MEEDVMSERVTAERLTLLDTVDRWFRLDQPVFVEHGQTYWVDRTTNELCVDRGDGRVTRTAGEMCR